MEEGLFLDQDVQELMAKFELFEIFTDDPAEGANRKLAREISGYLANPTYIVLDSRSHREVARSTFTNSKQDFIDFLRQGLTDEPAFRSLVRFENISIKVEGRDVVVLEPDGAPNVDESVLATLPEDEELDVSQQRRFYRGKFSGSQKFRVPAALADGDYVIYPKLIAGLYGPKLDYRETRAESLRVEIEVRR